MPSFLKGVLHSVASALAMWLPFAHFGWLNLTIGGVLAIVLNWIVSNTIPTTTGASARQ